MIRVAIAGAGGRMGVALIHAVCQSDDLTLAAGLERSDSPDLGRDLGEIAGLAATGVSIGAQLADVVDEFDVLIDFTIAEATAKNIDICRAHQKKMIVGTTGLNAEQQAALTLACEEIAVVKAHNFSVGVNATFKLVEIAAGIFGDDVDIEIVEAHHRHKVDSPSGTAIGMAEAVAGVLGRDLSEVATYGREGITGERERKTIGFHSIRAGDIVGDHTTIFAAAGERVEITHRAQSRANFAEGAVRAASWVVNQADGLFDMQDVLGLRSQGSSALD